MQKRISYLSWVRAVSAIAVVVLHTLYAVAQNFKMSQGLKAGLVTGRNLMLWAVPCFLMVTGALLLDPDHEVTLAKIFGKYIQRALTALICFSLIYYMFDLAVKRMSITWKMVISYLYMLYTGNSWANMWYLYLLIGLYLMLPFYRKITESRKLTYYFLVLHLIFLSFLPLLNALTHVQSAFYICTYTVYPFYLVLGYALRKRWVRISVGCGTVLLAAGAALYILFSRIAYMGGSKTLSELLNTYAFFPAIMMSCGIFSVAEAADNGKYRGTGLLAIDRCSFGIYLVHLLVLKFFIVVLKVNPTGQNYSWKLTVLTTVIFAISFLLVFAYHEFVRLMRSLKKAL